MKALSMRALLVEKDFLVLSSLRETLVAAGFEVHCASGPDEARRLLDRHTYGLVVIDIDLDSAAGEATTEIDVIRQAKRRSPGARVVALTADADDGSVDALGTLGAEICRARPGHLDRLRVQLAAVVRTTDGLQLPAEAASW